MNRMPPVAASNDTRGFTLVEVLIALAILAVALAAAMRAASLAVVSAEEARWRTYAVWVAQNRAAELSARRAFPSVGTENGTAKLGGAGFRWEQQSSATANPAFRKVDLRVFLVSNVATAPAQSSTDSERALANLSIYVSRAAGPATGPGTPSAGNP
jgi:general secretion pathway protein I